MSSERNDRDLERRLAAWMDDAAPRRVPDDLLEEAFARTSATRQARGPLRLPGFVSRIGGPRALVLVPLVLALGGAGLYAGSRPPTPTPVPSLAPTAALSPSPSASSAAVGYRSPLPLKNGPIWPCPDQLPVVNPPASSLPSAGTPSVALTVDSTADEVATGFGSVWVGSAPGGRVVRVDPATGRQIASIPIPSETGGWVTFAVTDSVVWVSEIWEKGIKARLIRIDPTVNQVTSTQSMIAPGFMSFDGEHLLASDIWNNKLMLLDAHTGREQSSIDLTGPAPDSRSPLPFDVQPLGVRAGDGKIWVAGGQSGELISLDQASGAITKRACVTNASELTNIGLGLGSVWAGEQRRGELVRLDATTGTLTARIPLPDVTNTAGLGPAPLVAKGRVWIPDGTAIWVVDPSTNTLVGQVSLESLGFADAANGATSIVEAGGFLWTQTTAPGQLIRITVP